MNIFQKKTTHLLEFLKPKAWFSQFIITYEIWFITDVFPTSSPAHLFAKREKRKRGPRTLQTHDQNLPK